VVIDDAARAFRRLAPMAGAELSTHPQLAHNARDQITIAAREAYMHRLPRMRLRCCAKFRNSSIDAFTSKAVFHRCGGGYGCPNGRHRTLKGACALRRRGVGRGNGPAEGRNYLGFHRLRLHGHTRSVRHRGVDSGNGRAEGRNSLRFHRLRLPGPRRSGRRCGCILLGVNRLRGDYRRVRCRWTGAVRGIDTHD